MTSFKSKKFNLFYIITIIISISGIIYLVVNRNNMVIHLAIFCGIAILQALSQDVVTGVTGQISVAQGAFTGIGAYVSAILSVKLGVSVWLSIPIAVISAGAISLSLGAVSVRLKGISLGIITLAFGELVFLLCLNWTGLTNGPMGISGIPSPNPLIIGGKTIILFNNRLNYLFLVLVTDIIVISALLNLIKSKWGKAMRATKENEIVALTMGININKYKILAFALAACIAGLSGTLYAHYIQYISPDTFVFTLSVTILSMAVIGGLGTIWGPVLGAIIITLLPEYLHGADEYRLIIYGLLVLITLAVFPRGLFPGLKSFFNHRMKSHE